MLQISKKVLICLTSLLIIVTCASCKTDAAYLVSNYLNYLAIKSGIGNSEVIDTNFNDLLNWGIVDDDDSNKFNDGLDYDYLSITINRLLESDGDLDYLKKIDLVDKNAKSNQDVDENIANDIVDKAVDIINHKSFTNKYKYEINDENNVYYDESIDKYKIVEYDENNNEINREAEFDEVFSYFDIEGSSEIDFSNAEVIPYQDEEDNSSYVNNKYNLLSSKNHVFNKNGYRISYTLNTSGISVHVSKQIDKINVFADLTIKNVKPSFKYTYEEGDLKNCYFNLSMNTTEQLGVSSGKYDKYYLKLKDLDSSSFSSFVKSMFVDNNDKAEALIPICEIKTPIPNVPTANLNLQLLLKFSISGKIELVLYNSHDFGFEIKDGNARFFWNHEDDADGIAKASGKACLGFNAGLDAATFRLCDVELDGGLKAEVKSTLHLYDSDGNLNSIESDIAYSTLEELSTDNPNVLVCGDLSLYWLFDIILNTSKSTLYKMGFTKTYHVFDEDNQVFGNLHHIENGQFVKKCTRKSYSSNSTNSLTVSSYDKITLNSYSEVLLIGETFQIELNSLPSAYSDSDITYKSLDTAVASVSNGLIKANDYGTCKIQVSTSDQKYNTYVNILVSTG